MFVKNATSTNFATGLSSQFNKIMMFLIKYQGGEGMASKIINSNTVLDFDGERFAIKQIRDGYINYKLYTTKHKGG